MAMVLVQATTGPTTTTKTVAPKARPKAHKPKAHDKTAQAIVEKLKAQGGSTTNTERGLAELLGTSRPTVRRALNSLVLAGMVGLEATKQGTFLRLT